MKEIYRYERQNERNIPVRKKERKIPVRKNERKYTSLRNRLTHKTVRCNLNVLVLKPPNAPFHFRNPPAAAPRKALDLQLGDGLAERKLPGKVHQHGRVLRARTTLDGLAHRLKG
jgi:hypothetical protein